VTAGLTLAVVIAAQRAALLRQDAATLQLLLRSWLPVQARLNESLARLLSAIGDDTPTPDQLRRMTRYRDLIEQTKTLTDGYAAGALPRITAAQRAATGMAGQHTAALLGPSGARLPVEAVSELVGALSDGSPLEKLLATFGDDAAKAASQTLVDGLATGRGLRVVASEFRKATGASAVRAARISRTETLRAYRGATLETYKENRKIVKQWRWLSARQARTCASCWARDGMIFDVDEPFVSHINCRCSPTPVLPDVPAGATGAELFNRLEDAQQRGILGRGRFELFKAGELDITDIPVEVDAGRWGKALRQRTLRQLGGTTTRQPMRAYATFRNADDAYEWQEKAGRAWRDSLTEEEYTQLSDYQRTDFRFLNKTLRAGDALPEGWDEMVVEMDRAISRGVIDQDTVVYRGFNARRLADSLDELPGRTITDQGYVSTSASPEGAEKFRREAMYDDKIPVIAEIRVPKGTNAAYMQVLQPEDHDNFSFFYREAEILLPRDTKMRIVSTSTTYDEDNEPIHRLIMEVVSG